MTGREKEERTHGHSSRDGHARNGVSGPHRTAPAMAGIVSMAARGARNMDVGVEPIGDAAERDALREQARRVHRLALLMAGLLTAAAMLLP